MAACAAPSALPGFTACTHLIQSSVTALVALRAEHTHLQSSTWCPTSCVLYAATANWLCNYKQALLGQACLHMKASPAAKTVSQCALSKTEIICTHINIQAGCVHSGWVANSPSAVSWLPARSNATLCMRRSPPTW